MFKHYLLYILLFFSQSLFAQSLSFSIDAQILCKGKTEQLSISASGNFKDNNYFKIQLSDSLGSFVNQTELGSFVDTSLTSFSFVLPDTIQLGTKYRLRIVSTNPEIISDDNGTNLTIIDNCKVFSKPIISLQNISSNIICSPETISINWLVTNSNFTNSDSLIIQLSDSSGSFKSPINLNTISVVNTSFNVTIPEELAESMKYRIRIITSDSASISNDNGSDITIKHKPKPVILSNKLGYILTQNICTDDLETFRIQGWGGKQGELKYNGVTVYVGSNIDYKPNPLQSGIYNILWTENGCTNISPDLKLNILTKPTAQLTGNKLVDDFNSTIDLTIKVNSADSSIATISGIDSVFHLNNTTNNISIHPTQNTEYILSSIANSCGVGTVSGSAEVILCPNSIVLNSQKDTFDNQVVIKETNSENGEIVATNKIINNANVKYNSGKSIVLGPGFSTTEGVIFKAEIGGCKFKNTITTNPTLVIKDTTNNTIIKDTTTTFIKDTTITIITDTTVIIKDTTTTIKDTLIVPIAAKFKIGFQKIYGNATQIISEMTDFATHGATFFETSIRLEDVFKSLSQYNENNPTLLNKYWDKYDKIINHANKIYESVAIRIIVDYDDTRYYFQERDENNPHNEPYTNYDNALFNLFGGEIVQDQFGNPARVGYGSGHGSFASMTAREKMKGFVQKVMDRYQPILGEKLYWVSVVNSAQFETGMNYENAWNGKDFTDPRPCEYDYSPENITQFRNWLVTQRYAGLSELNSAYNTNFTEASQIQPPKVGVNTLDNMNWPDVIAMYNSVLFEDWYKYNYQQLKSFLLECKEVIKSKNNNIKFCFEAGSNTDQLSAARKTFNIPDINTYADVLKTTFQTSSFAGARAWDADLVRSNFMGEIESEINESDVVTIGGITDPSTVKQKMLEYSKMAYLNKAKSIIFIADKGTPYYNNSLDALGEFKSWVDNHTEQFSEGETINVNLSDLIRNFSSAIAPFNNLAPSLPASGYENRPKIIINPNN